MKPSTGRLARLAFIGAGFIPTADTLAAGVNGIPADDGTFATHMEHPGDGRGATIHTYDGNGWQLGGLIHADGTNTDLWNATTLRHTKVSGVRAMLAEHDPDRELTYGAWPAIRQARVLDGRERDILCRILNDIIRAVRDPEWRDRLTAIMHLEGPELLRLIEVRAVLETRND